MLVVCRAVDEILSHETETVQERILSLEKKVQQQDDEIVCLKSALADALRRLTALESGMSVCQSRLSVCLSVCLPSAFFVTPFMTTYYLSNAMP